jgi:2TM domain-containing protein
MDAFERSAQREQDIRRRQREQRHAREKKTGLRIHAAVYVGVQLLLLSMWALAGAGYPWFLYPLLGWGIGLVAHYVAVRDRIRNRPHGHA